MDDHKVDDEPDWGLPVPNEEAAYKSLAKYGKDMPVMSNEDIILMNEAWEMTAEHFGPYMRNSKVRSYTEVKDKLDKSTSTGAPFNSLYPTKKELFENDPDIDEWMEKDWEKLATDKDWTCVATNSLKEEIRPSEKTKLNKIRTFTAMPVDATVHGNRLFADMNENMNSSWLKSSSTVGWSPMMGNWDTMIRKLKTFNKGYALDESEYDSSIRSYMMWGCARFRWSMLRPEDQTTANWNRIRTYYRNLINTVIISPVGVLIMKLAGNPSGSCNTINDNTLVLYCLMCFAWLKLSPDDKKTLGHFELNTAKCLCGDDNTWTVSDIANEFYNARTVIKVWDEIGITTTTDCLDPREPDELDYLSAHTVYLNGVAVPQYNKAKILTSLLYSTKSKQTPALALERTNGQFLISYTDVVLREFLRKVQQWLIWEYDKICANDPEWIVAKCGILSDERLMKLWTGEAMIICPQSISTARKINKRNKMTTRIIKETFKPRKRGGRGPNKKGKATRMMGPNNSALKEIVVWGGQNPVRQRRGRQGRNRPRNGPRRGRNDGSFFKTKGPMGRGSTRQTQLGMEMTTFTRDEYIAEVTGAATAANFGVTAYSVNPGQTTTFPWLGAVVGNRFEKYQFDSLEFYIKREVSEFATAGAQGKMGLSFDADAADAPPATKQQAEDTHPQASGMPCENISLKIPRQILYRLNDGHYIRPAGLPANTDIKTYDLGNLNVWTQNLGANTATVGELHVRYRVRCFIPVLENTAGAPANNQVYTAYNASIAAGGTTVPAALTFSGATQVVNGIAVVNSGGTLTLPAGNYVAMCSANIANSTSSVTTATLQLYKNNATVGGAYLTGITGSPDGSGSLFLPCFIQSNGTDTYAFVVTCTYAGGVTTMQGNLLIMTI